MQYHYTYLIENLINNKKYIGVRSTNVIPEMDDYWGSSVILTNEIKIQGVGKFNKTIISEFNSRREAQRHEIELHDTHQVATSNEYYNKANAMHVGFDRTGTKHSAETILKMAMAKKGKKLTIEHKKKISESCSGEKNAFYGKSHTATTRQKMSDNHADFTGENAPNFGKRWYNNGVVAKFFRPGSEFPGFTLGRKW